jgi:hypothetical protein
MGWEKRHGKLYYYTKERIGNRVISQYVGCSETARLIGQFEQLRREERAEQRAAVLAEVERIEAEDQEAEEILARVDLLVTDFLLSSGFHQHKGQWRRIRWPKKDSQEPQTKPSR